MSALFQPFTLKDVSLRNRIAVPPMCQYSANDGLINEWHLANYTSQARGGAGLVIVEATAVSPEGRITPGCAGIWNDQLAEAFVPVVRGIKANGAVPGAFCANATTGILSQIDGFEGVKQTFYPVKLMEQIESFPGVRTTRLYENDAGDVIDAVKAGQLAQ